MAKTVVAAATHYLYDLGGNLIAEADGGTGAATAEYVALEGKPLAYIATAAIYWVHGDHLGTPQVLTDAAGAVVWDATYRPFGEAIVTGALAFNLRFPGQYEDAETGLHYNYFRDYDPSTGRYIQSDPIGLGGGWNTYGYVDGSPLMRLDITGLGWKVISIDVDAYKQLDTSQLYLFNEDYLRKIAIRQFRTSSVTEGLFAEECMLKEGYPKFSLIKSESRRAVAVPGLNPSISYHSTIVLSFSYERFDYKKASYGCVNANSSDPETCVTLDRRTTTGGPLPVSLSDMQAVAKGLGLD